MEFLPDSGHAVPRESGETMNRRPRETTHWRSSLTSTPIRSHRGKCSWSCRCFRSRRQRWYRATGHRREIVACQDRRADAGERFISTQTGIKVSSVGTPKKPTPSAPTPSGPIRPGAKELSSPALSRLAIRSRAARSPCLAASASTPNN